VQISLGQDQFLSFIRSFCYFFGSNRWMKAENGANASGGKAKGGKAGLKILLPKNYMARELWLSRETDSSR